MAFRRVGTGVTFIRGVGTGVIFKGGQKKEGSPKPLGNPKWKKDHNFPLFIGSMADGGRARFLHWAGKFGSHIDDTGNGTSFSFSAFGFRFFVSL